jgi:hypothetical protein
MSPHECQKNSALLRLPGTFEPQFQYQTCEQNPHKKDRFAHNQGCYTDDLQGKENWNRLLLTHAHHVSLQSSSSSSSSLPAKACNGVDIVQDGSL